MSLMEYIKRDYQEYVALHVKNPDLRDALKTHERIPLFYTNLAKEIGQCKVHVSRETVKRAVYDMTAIFVGAIEKKAEEGRLSDLEKTLRVSQAEAAKERDAIASEWAKNMEVQTHGSRDSTPAS